MRRPYSKMPAPACHARSFMSSRVATALLVVVCCAHVVVGQAPQQPTFRVQVEAIEIDASVTDASGHVVTDLTQRRLRDPRERQAADHHVVRAGEYPAHACRASALRGQRDRARRAVQQPGRGTAVRDRPRPGEGPADPAHAAIRAALPRAVLRAERPRCRGLPRPCRPLESAGVDEQPTTAAPGRRLFHGRIECRSSSSGSTPGDAGRRRGTHSASVRERGGDI